MSGFISDKMLGLFEEKIKSITRKADDEEEESSEQIQDESEEKKIMEQREDSLKKSMTKHLDEVVRNSVAIPSKKEKDTDKFPKAYFINNLLKLSNVLSFSEIEKVALIQAERSGVSYAKILLCLGIQKFVCSFYEKHDQKVNFDNRYNFQEIQRQIIPFLQFFKTKDRLLLNKIVRGTCKRFQCEPFYNDRWLTNKLIQKKKALESKGITLNQELQEVSRTRVELEDTENYPYKPNKKQLIPINYKRMYPELQLEDKGDQLLQNPQVKHNKRQLYFWFKKQKGDQDNDSLGQKSQSQNDAQQESSQDSEPIPLKFLINVGLTKLPNEEKIYKIDDSSEQMENVIEVGKQSYQPPMPKRQKRMIKSQKKQIKKDLSKLDFNDEEPKSKAIDEQPKFKIKITPDQINKIINSVESNMKKTIRQLSNETKLSQNNVSFVFEKKEDYKKMLSSKDTSLMEANSIITEKKQTPKPIDPNASDGFDEDTILDLLDIRMRKYLQKSQESNIKVICAECERILERLKVSKERQKVLVKSWMRKFIGRQ